MNGCPPTCCKRSMGSKEFASGKSRGQMITNGFRALVVDDNPIVRKCTASMLEGFGFGTHMASDGVEALSRLKDSFYHLVLTDYAMPFLDGHQLGQTIKGSYLGTRVVIMTGMCQAEMAEMMSGGQIDGWLFKPFRMEDLEAMLTSIGLPISAFEPIRHRLL